MASWDETYANLGPGGMNGEGVEERGTVNYKVIFVEW
jgi:hypothetical protein